MVMKRVEGTKITLLLVLVQQFNSHNDGLS
jgi:hypothetical protein